MEINLGMSEREVGIGGNFSGRGIPVGNKLKSTGGWSGKVNGTNESGFSALPGAGSYEGKFYGVGFFGNWWSSTEAGKEDIWVRHLSPESAGVARTPASNGCLSFTEQCISFKKQCEISICCVRD